MLFEIKCSENIVINSKYDLHKLCEAEKEDKLKVNKHKLHENLVLVSKQ